MKVGKPGLLLLGLLMSGQASVRAEPVHSSSDYGGVGLLQVPTARFADDGQITAGISIVYPYHQALLGMQLLPWLETQLRYVDVRNRLYGPEDFSGDQTYKDRSIDFKIRLLKEGEALPSLALGVMDIGGTGLFSSEYLVATRRVWNFDFTLGLAWGRLGSRGGIKNPFTLVSSAAEERDALSEPGGVPVEKWFRGREVGLFGGVEWQTPVQGLSLKLEYDGNDYQHEAATLDDPPNNQEIHFPVNAALNWRLANAVDLSVGVERGDTAMFRVSAFTNLVSQKGPPKILDPVPTPAYASEQASKGDPLKREASVDTSFLSQLEQELARQRITLIALDADDDRGVLTVWFTQKLTRDPHRAIGRISQTLAVLAPPQYGAFTVANVDGERESYRVTTLREDIAAAVDFKGSVEEIRASSLVDTPSAQAYAGADFQQPPKMPAFSWSMGPALRQHIGGPDDFYFGQLWWRVGANLDLTSRWSINGSVGANIYNNFDGLKVRDTSELPHVRSDIVQYMKEGENNIVRLETNYVWPISQSWTARVSAGIFEEMYGGLAGEVLYAKPYQPWAVGFNLNRVRKRDFDQRFGFQDYEVTTGHLTGYFDLPLWNLEMTVSVGRYLAGDYGGTFQLARVFPSGVKVGAFATKTDVSAEQFGEGSFDKGLFLYLPLDLFSLRSSQRGAMLVFKPLTRDGGQKVRDGAALYGRVEANAYDQDASWVDVLK